MGKEHEGGEAEQVRGIAVQLVGAAEEHRRRHDGGSHHGDVAANEQRVESDRRHRDRPLRDGPRAEPAQGSHEQRGHERHLGSRQGEHVVGARGPEGVGRRIVDPRAVSQNHRANQAVLGPRRYEAREHRPGVLTHPRRHGAKAGSPGPHLEEPLALDGAAGVDSVVECGLARVERAGGAKPGDRPDGRPDTQPVPVEHRGPPRLTTDIDAYPPRDGARSSRALDPVDVEDEQGSIGEHREVTPRGPLERHRSPVDGAGIGEGPERSRLVGQPLDRSIRGAEGHGPAQKGNPGGTAAPRGQCQHEHHRCEPPQGEGAGAA